MSKEGKAGAAVSAMTGSSVLMGRYDHALDPKKRFTIPSEWRRAMGDPEYVFVVPDPREKCLDVIPRDLMEKRLAEMQAKALFDPTMAKAMQVIGANSEQLMLDVQGRVRVSDRLLAFAHLTTSVAMVGAVRMIKLWDPKAITPADRVDQKSLSAAMEQIGF